MITQDANVLVQTGIPATPVRRSRRRLGRPPVLVYVLLTALLIFALGPILLFILDSFKSRPELASNPLGIPGVWKWSNYVDAWQQANMAAGIGNSFILVIGTVIGVCIVSGCGAYALARLKVAGGGLLIGYLLVTSTLPVQLFLVPLFYLWTKVGLYDSLFGVIVIYVATQAPFLTLLLRSFMLDLPGDFEDAARIDGAGELTVLFRVVLPNVLPGLFTVALIGGLGAYNEFLFAVTFLQSANLQPLSLALFAFQDGYGQDYSLISAAGVITMVPMLVLFLAMQRRFVAGLASSGTGGT